MGDKKINPEQVSAIAKALETIGLLVLSIVGLFKRKKKTPEAEQESLNNQTEQK